MPERRQHDALGGVPKSLPPLETREEYDAIMSGLPEMERGLEMMPRSSELRLPLARIVASIRQRVREFEQEHGLPRSD